MAAVEKIEDQRKPDDFFGHRNRGARLFWALPTNIVVYPGVAQLVARLLWEQDAASSSLATWTKNGERQMPFPVFASKG